MKYIIRLFVDGYNVLSDLFQKQEFHNMARGTCHFSEKFVEQFTWIEPVPDDNTKAKCSICKVTFSIKNKGKFDVEQHASSEKHKTAASVGIKSKITGFFHKKKIDNDDLRIARMEMTWCYHNIQHNHSFRSMDCTSKLLKKFVSAKFSCARTKTKCAIQNVLAKFADEAVMKELAEANFVVVACDASNHNAIKLLPVLIR